MSLRARSADELTAATTQFMSDPQVQQLLQQWQAFHAQTGTWSDRRGPSSYETAIRQRLAASGIDDVRIDFSGPQGSPILKNRGLEGWMYPLIIGGIAFSGGLAAGAFGGSAAAAGAAGGAGGAGAAGGGAAAGGVLPATSLATGAPGVGLGAGAALPAASAGGIGAAGVGGAAAGGAAGGGAGGAGAGGGGSGWLVPTLLGAGSTIAQLYGGHQQANAARTAAEQQAQSAREALALQREMYETTRGDLAPYRGAGTQGLTALTALLGLPAAPAAAAPPAPAPTTSLGALAIPRTLTAEEARARLQALGFTPTVPGRAPLPTSTPVPGRAVPRAATVQMRAPTGQVSAVPADQVSFYEARGARRV